ncbi:LIC_13387 family protein [Terriglobus albidus]|uniref:LIC_13387 family protein n=1 Tax=Terriglobus albidus TaxID=1592106 RepID=UPI003D7C244E
MSENRPKNMQLPGFPVSPTVLIRLSSVLVVLLMAGHASAYPWTSTHLVREAQLVDSMKAVDFEFMGERSTYWSLYFGWGLLIGILLLTLATILWLLADLARLAPRRVGVITGIISASCVAGAYLSFRFFYVPPFLFYSALCLVLLAATVQLLRQETRFPDGETQ